MEKIENTSIKLLKIQTTKIPFYREFQESVDHSARILLHLEVCITAEKTS